MRLTAKEQELADECAREGGHFFCANYIGRLTNELYENAPVFSPSHDNSFPYDEGLPMIIVVANDKATFFDYPLSSDYLDQMKSKRDYSKGRRIFKKYQSIVEQPNLVSKSEYIYIKRIVEACNKYSYDRPIDKQTMYQFLEMADRLDMGISVLPIKETMDRCDGWEYYLKLVKKPKDFMVNQSKNLRFQPRLIDVDKQLDETFGKVGTPERANAEEQANAFFAEQMQEDISEVLEYKGYKGSVAYSIPDQCFVGKVLDMDKDLILYEGKTLDELREDFEKGVDSYLLGRSE